MKSKSKRIISIFIVLLYILALTSCTQNTASKAEYIDDMEDNSPLQIYLMDWDRLERESIKEFNNLVASKKIDGRKIEITEFDLEHIDDMYSRISSEMMAGGGPDILLIDTSFNCENDFVKMSQQNSFADMDILASSSGTFKFDDYNEMVLDAGIINGTRTLMPYSYSVPYAFTTKEVLEENNIELPENMTYESLFSMISTYEKTHPISKFNISTYLLSDIFSLNNPTLELDSEITKKYHSRIRKEFEANDNSYVYKDHFNGTIKGEDLLYIDLSSNENQFAMIASVYNITNSYFDNNIIFFGIPSDSKGNTKAYINRSMTININSKHKNDAFKFVEYMMSYDVAVSKEPQETFHSDIKLPVNKKAYEEYKRVFTTEALEYHCEYEDKYCTGQVISADLAKQSIDIIEGVKTCEFNGHFFYLYNCGILEPLQDYYKGEIDYDTMVEQINNKYYIYKSE